MLLDVYDFNSAGFVTREAMAETIEHDMLSSDSIEVEKVLNLIYGAPNGTMQQITYEQLLNWVKLNRNMTALTLWVTESTKRIEGALRLHVRIDLQAPS